MGAALVAATEASPQAEVIHPARPLRMTARTYTRSLAQLRVAEERALAAIAGLAACGAAARPPRPPAGRWPGRGRPGWRSPGRSRWVLMR
jgi:hypothetical protein